MQRYGLIVADNGSDMYISGTFDTRWDNGILNPAFGALTANDFEVIQRGWQYRARTAGNVRIVVRSVEREASPRPFQATPHARSTLRLALRFCPSALESARWSRAGWRLRRTRSVGDDFTSAVPSRCSQSSMPRASLALDVVHELVDLALHLLDLAPQVEDDLHAGQVHAEIARQRQDRLELLEILFRIQPGVAFGPRRLQQAFTLVEAERLRMDVVLLRHRADHVIRLATSHTLCHVATPGRSRR